MSTTTKNLTVFLDSIGRTIIGNVVKEDDTILAVENPALVHIQPSPQTSQLQLQLLPLFFKEFQADKTAPTVWNYKKNAITLSNSIEFHGQFLTQYQQLFAAPVAPPQGEPQVVKLFDSEGE